MAKTCRTCGETKPDSDFYARTPRCKVCISIADKEKRKTLTAEQREYMRARANRWRAENRERDRETHRVWNEAHPDVVKSYKRKWASEHADKLPERHRKWREANPERWREICGAAYSRYRARKNDASVVESFNRSEIIQRDGGRCHFCGRVVPASEIHIDHLVPISWDGTEHSRRNVAVSCASCNLKNGPGRMPAQLRLIG